MQIYTKEEYWALYKNLPPEVQSAFLSEETATNIKNIAERYNVAKKTGELAKVIGLVLLGLVPLSHISKKIEEELGVKKNIAQSIEREIFQFIFSPIKLFFTTTTEENSEKPAPKEATPPQWKKKNGVNDSGADPYREKLN